MPENKYLERTDAGFNAEDQPIQNVAAPVEGTDAATRGWTETQLAGKSDTAHIHDDRYYTESEIDTQMGGKSDTGHDHTESDITDLDHDAQKIKSKLVDAPLAGDDGRALCYDHGSGTYKHIAKAASIHNHDTLYYTESEVDTQMSGKSDTGHTHLEEDITDLDHNAQKIKDKTVDAPIVDDDGKALVYNHSGSKYEHIELAALVHTHDDRYYTETEIDSQMNGKSNTGHIHDDRYYTKSQTDTLLSGKSDTSHTHDDRYYTEAEIDIQMGGKSDTGHDHTESDITDLDHDAQKIKTHPIDAPVEGDDGRALVYNHGGNKYEHIAKANEVHTHLEADITDLDHDAQKIKGITVQAPVAGDDGLPLVYDHGSALWKPQIPPAIVEIFSWSVAPTINHVYWPLGSDMIVDTAEAVTSAAPLTIAQPAFNRRIVLNISGASGLPFTVRITGVSVNQSTDAQTPADTEDIAVDANGYYRTTKYWLDDVAISIVEATKSFTTDVHIQCVFNNAQQTNLIVHGLCVSWTPSAVSWDFGIDLDKANADGSLTSIDSVLFDQLDSPVRAAKNEPGKYRRDDYAQLIDVLSGEGVLLKVTEAYQDAIELKLLYSYSS